MSRWKTWTARLGCLGCLGTLALGGAGTLGTIGTIGYAGYLLQQHWENTLRAQLVDPTNGELDFDDIQLALDSVTLTGVTLSSSTGDELLTVETMTAYGDPWSWTADHITITSAELDGVHVNLVRTGAEWTTPSATLALFQSGSSLALPKTDVTSLKITRVTAALGSPEGVVNATIADIDVPAVSATMAPGLLVDHGRITAHDLTLEVPDGESVAVKEVGLDLPTLTPYLAALSAENVDLQGISATVPSKGWTLPGRLPAILHTASGPQLPPVSATHIAGSSLDLRVRGSQARAQISAMKVPSLVVSEGKLEPLTLTLTAPKLTGEGPGAASTDFLSVTLPPIGAGSTLGLGHVHAGPTTATLVKGATDLGLPVEGFALLRLAGGGPTRIHLIEAPSATAEFIEGSGTVTASVSTLAGNGLVMGPKWSIESANTGAVRIFEGDRDVVTVASSNLSAGGVLTVRNAKMRAAITEERRLVLPTIAMSHVPAWLGGTSTNAWLGFDLAALPWRPQKLVVEGADVLVKDAAFVSPPVRWELDVGSFTLGPMTGDSLPFHLETRVAKGKVIASGNLKSTASIRSLSIDARRLDLTAFEAYAAPMLERFGISILTGRVKATLTGNLLDSRLNLKGPTIAWDLSLKGHTPAGKVLARGRIDRVEVPVELHGDLSDPDFSPIAEVTNGLIRGLTGQGATLKAGDLSLDTTDFTSSLNAKSKTAGKAADSSRDRADQAKDDAAKAAQELGNALKGKFKR